MEYNENGLEKLIIEKNVQLDSLNQNSNPDSEELHRAYVELDRVLFLYYKSLGSKKNLITLKKLIR